LTPLTKEPWHDRLCWFHSEYTENASIPENTPTVPPDWTDVAVIREVAGDLERKVDPTTEEIVKVASSEIDITDLAERIVKFGRRWREILDGISRALSNEEIANELKLTVRSVSNSVTKIYSALDLTHLPNNDKRRLIGKAYGMYLESSMRTP